MTGSSEDLPFLWEHPSYDVLLTTLQKLHLQPRGWDLAASSSDIGVPDEDEYTPWHRREVSAYLADIVKSRLAWLEEDSQREHIWTEASRRLSERCGRTAMGEVIRTWKFQSDDHAPFQLVIREPPLVGDSLGLKTWGSSYVMAQLLPAFKRGALSHLFTASQAPAVCELGSGTGLLGLAAAAAWQVNVVLSDLAEIMPNLTYNAEENSSTILSAGGSIATGALKWGGSPEEIDPLFRNKNRFQIILAADPLYDDDHPGLLANTIHEQLSPDPTARALVMVPERDNATKRLLSDFKKEMSLHDHPFLCLKEDRVLGKDDWGEHGESDLVKYWWGVFQRSQVDRVSAHT